MPFQFMFLITPFMHGALSNSQFTPQLCVIKLLKPNLNQLKFMKKIFSLVAISVLVFSCTKKDEEKKNNDFTGTAVQVYGGKAWSNVTLDNQGDPKQLSLVLNNDLLNSVPVGGEDHPEHNAFIIPVHQKGIEKTPFKFIMLNWNPNGHEPDQIYTHSHFDFHFYTTTPDQ